MCTLHLTRTVSTRSCERRAAWGHRAAIPIGAQTERWAVPGKPRGCGSCASCRAGSPSRDGPRQGKPGTTHVDLALLGPEVPLQPGVHVRVERHLQRALPHGPHFLQPLRAAPRARGSAQPRRLRTQRQKGRARHRPERVGGGRGMAGECQGRAGLPGSTGGTAARPRTTSPPCPRRPPRCKSAPSGSAAATPPPAGGWTGWSSAARGLPSCRGTAGARSCPAPEPAGRPRTGATAAPCCRHAVPRGSRERRRERLETRLPTARLSAACAALPGRTGWGRERRAGPWAPPRWGARGPRRRFPVSRRAARASSAYRGNYCGRWGRSSLSPGAAHRVGCARVTAAPCSTGAAGRGAAGTERLCAVRGCAGTERTGSSQPYRQGPLRFSARGSVPLRAVPHRCSPQLRHTCGPRAALSPFSIALLAAVLISVTSFGFSKVLGVGSLLPVL